ncbi:hypothetical protein MRS76_14550 [Rhizobiaceae bacterium n13]|uniref:Uncharacterized protein n=1 Tax=Ferirhizobium litorale TaxID=2927786 RepID=A0AAE3QH89_9HYPH|nr:hypothetical protein [Fererhizobium litorale]MDI7863177.1 hypothetical protein [Fererhizobium litorale]MDI7923088.1 hypothetical protein [Fererhizobium litorale]
MLTLMIAVTVSVSLIAESLSNHIRDNYEIEWARLSAMTGRKSPEEVPAATGNLNAR